LKRLSIKARVTEYRPSPHSVGKANLSFKWYNQIIDKLKCRCYSIFRIYGNLSKIMSFK